MACGGNDGLMRRLDARDGKERWTYAAGRSDQGPCRSRFGSGQLVFGAFDGGVHALDVATGECRWRVGTHDIVYSTPRLAGRRAFVAGADKYLHVIDLDAGEEEAALFTGARLFGSPALIEGRVLFGNTAGELYEIDPDTLRVTAFGRFAGRDYLRGALRWEIRPLLRHHLRQRGLRVAPAEPVNDFETVTIAI